MYSLSKNKNTYIIMRVKRRKPKGWIISSRSYMDLIKIANNLMNDIPKIHLKRTDLTNTSSSIESIIKEEIDIDCSLSINEALNESTEINQQDVKPNISKTNLCNTFFENLLLNDKTADNTESYTDLEKIANNLTNDIPKVHLKRIDLTNTSSSIKLESIIKEEIDIDDCSLSRNEVLDESTEKDNQQDVKPNISKTNLCNTFYENLLLNDKTADNTENIYKDSKEYNNVPDYEVSNDSENSDDESNTSIVSQSFNENEKSNTTNGSLDTPQYSYEGKASCDDTNLIVPKSETKGLGKKSFCMYCKKLQGQLSRHLENVHKNETEVKKLISFPKGSSKRKAIIDTIRKKSNFIFNTSSQYNTGELLVSRRSAKAKPASDFICCPKCKGFFTKKSIWFHFRKCSKSHSINRSFRVLARKIQGRIHDKACDMIRNEIFPVLKDDDVSKVIRYDELVILLANKLSKKCGNERYRKMIRDELRLLGRYLISIKKFNSNITDFASIYQLCHYDSCIVAIKNLAQFDPDTNKFKKQSIATRLRLLLKKLGNLLATEYIKRDDNEGSRNVDNFLKRLQEDYGTILDKVAEETVTQNYVVKIELPVVTSTF